MVSNRWGAERIVHVTRCIGLAINQVHFCQRLPLQRTFHVIICNKQAVLVRGGILVGFIFQRICIHRAHISKGHIVQGAVRQIAVYRSGNIHCRKVKIVSAAGGEGELLVRLTFHRQRDIRKSTCKVGLAVTVILFIEYLHGIVARCNVRRDFDFNRSAFGSRLCYSAVILCAVVIRQDDRDIFIFPCGRPFVIQRNGIVGGGADSFFRHGKIASTI